MEIATVSEALQQAIAALNKTISSCDGLNIPNSETLSPAFHAVAEHLPCCVELLQVVEQNLQKVASETERVKTINEVAEDSTRHANNIHMLFEAVKTTEDAVERERVYRQKVSATTKIEDAFKELLTGLKRLMADSLVGQDQINAVHEALGVIENIKPSLVEEVAPGMTNLTNLGAGYQVFYSGTTGNQNHVTGHGFQLNGHSGTFNYGRPS